MQVDHADEAVPVMDSEEVNSEKNIVHKSDEVIHAGFWLRTIALVLDFIALYSLNVIIRLVAGQAIDNPSFSFSFFELLYGIAYFVTMTSLFGQTLGKMVMGIKVVRIIPDQSDTVLHAGVAMYREFVGKLLSLMTFGIGFLMAGWSRNHRALHDMVSDTFVVLVKEKENEHE